MDNKRLAVGIIDQTDEIKKVLIRSTGDLAEILIGLIDSRLAKIQELANEIISKNP